MKKCRFKCFFFNHKLCRHTYNLSATCLYAGFALCLIPEYAKILEMKRSVVLINIFLASYKPGAYSNILLDYPT